VESSHGKRKEAERGEKQGFNGLWRCPRKGGGTVVKLGHITKSRREFGVDREPLKGVLRRRKGLREEETDLGLARLIRWGDVGYSKRTSPSTAKRSREKKNHQR